MSQNVAPCDDPPGGEMVCERGQLAICRVRNGKAVGSCSTPSQSILESGSLAFENWVLSVVTQTARHQSRRITRNDREILDSGSYLAHDGTTVRFRPPDSEALSTEISSAEL